MNNPIYTSTWTFKNTKYLYTTKVSGVVVTKSNLNDVLNNQLYINRALRKYLLRERKYLIPTNIQYDTLIGYTNY